MRNKKKYINRIFILTLLAVMLSSCREVVITIDEIPANTPAGAAIYVTGNFNYWDPGDNNFQMELTKDSTYTITLPKVLGTVEYKFTRGDWTTVEKNKCGLELADRVLTRNDNDSVVHTIESWSDLDPINCDSITIVLTGIPPETPMDEQIKIAGNFNTWNPGNDSSYVLKPNPETNELTVTIPVDSGRSPEDIVYKIVRGNDLKSEVDEFGNKVDKRKLLLSKEGRVYINVEGWEDLTVKRLNTVTIVLTDVPENTPPFDDIYLAGNFNDWQSGDPAYRFFRSSEGKYSITIPRLEYGLSFKVTREGWHTEAADRYGHKLNNQDYNYDDIDTVFMRIDNWADRPILPMNYLTIFIEKLPANTPAGSSIYLASSVNNWQPGNNNYQFFEDENGNLSITVTSRDRWISYKITRGSWESEAADERGRKLSNSDYEFRTGNDTVYTYIDNWADLPRN
jgi:hypothetical protein